ncbi:MAG: hypothetical protein SOS23_03090 [Streptococcus hyovaginalis]|nr:hypothetical protein [Streptococcus hyovaginalis]
MVLERLMEGLNPDLDGGMRRSLSFEFRTSDEDLLMTSLSDRWGLSTPFSRFPKLLND